MPSLSSLLVQREAASMRAVEDAIARQVLHGGDLATNLLETGAVREAVLLPILAECFELKALPAGLLPAPATAALRMVPGELAIRHGILPLELEGRTLVVATAEPLSPAVEDDLAFALDVAVLQRLALLVRIRQAIAAHYNIPLDRRLLRLIAKLEGRADPSPSSLPPPDRAAMALRMPRHISVPAPTFGTGLPSSSLHLPDRYVSQPTPVVGSPAAQLVGPLIPIIPPTPALPALDVPLSTPERPATTKPSAPPLAGPAPAPAPAPASEPPAAEAAASPPEPARKPTEVKALAGWVRQALRQDRSGQLDKNARARPLAQRPRRKGPFTAPMAEAELEQATTADEAFGAFFGFAAQFFEYAAFFAVIGEVAEGRDADGPGADRTRVATLGVPLDLPSAFSKARERKAPVLGRFSSEGLDHELAIDLGRQPNKAAVLVLPLTVKTRAVALLYGDDGQQDVNLASLGEVISIAALAGAALERIALQRKRGPRTGAEGIETQDAPAVAVVVKAPGPGLAARGARRTQAKAGQVEALARAFAGAPQKKPVEPQAEEDSGVSPGAASVPGALLAARATDAPAYERTLTSATEMLGDQAAGDASQAISAAAESPPVQRSAPPMPAVVKRPTHPGIGIIVSPAGAPPPPPPPYRPSDAPRTRPLDPGEPFPRARAGADAPDAPVREPQATRRGVAPAFQGRSSAPLPEGGESPRIVRRGPLASDKPIPREDVEERASASARSAMIERPPVSPVGSNPPLPSVIVDVAAEYASLLQRATDGGAGAQEAFAELVRHGEQVIGLVMGKFPGPLKVDRHRARDQLPAASQCGPLLELIVAIRRPALPFISVRTSSPDIETRFWATHVLGELRYPEAANVLVPRLFDDDLSVRRIARRSAAALVSAGEAGAPILQGLDHMTRNVDQPVPHRILAIETMGEIRTGAMVPPLVAVLSDSSDAVADAARRALLLIARQDFARDAKRWGEWWLKNATRHRIEWLIDALMHEQPPVRRAAGDELKQLTKEYFGYYDDLPKKEREKAQELYRAWWEREGKMRFA